jgi:uncharacterized protein YbjT (DUF2867 family)
MNVLLFGATGMVGDGVLHECLGDPHVSSVLAIGRSPLGITHPKLRELRRKDFSSFHDLAGDLKTIDACFFCLGVSSAGMNETEYHRQTFDPTLAVARALASVRPDATFCYVSGEGTDSTAKGRTMWARVKGETENALLALLPNAFMFRPGFIRPRPGKASKTLLYRAIYAVAGPLYPLLKLVAGSHVTTVENMGRAMVGVSTVGYPKRILENSDINALATAARQ